MYSCAACGDDYQLEQVYDDGHGKVICHGCYEIRAAAAAVPPPAVATPGGGNVRDATAGHGTANHPNRRRGSGAGAAGARTPWIVAGAVTAVFAVAAVVVFVLRPGGAPTTGSSQAAVPSEPGQAEPETNLRRVNRLWREARDRAKQRDHAAAAGLYAQLFAAIEADPHISGNRSLMADLTPARKEWALANDAAGLPALPGTIKPKTALEAFRIGWRRRCRGCWRTGHATRDER